MSLQPGNLASLVPDGDDWIARKFRELQQQIDELRGARRLEAASIGAGGLHVKGGTLSIEDDGSLTVIDPSTGRTVTALGTGTVPDGSGRRQMFAIFSRDDGTVALALADLGITPGHPHQQALQWWDRVGNVVLADDTTSGQGIARPWLSLGQWDDGSYPTQTTTSATFATLAQLGGYRQQPRLNVQCLARASDATTAGEVRLLFGASTVLDTKPIPAGAFQYINFATVSLPAGNFGDPITLSIQARRTAGTGTIGVRGTLAVGAQS